MPTPVTELPNELTGELDTVGALGIVRLLRSTDAQIFAGWGGLPSLYDRIPEIDRVAAMASLLLAHHESSAIVMSGSGTSGRIAFLVAVNMNRLLVAAGKTPCFRYLMSGGDPALLISDELPEDDTELAVADLQAAAAGKERVLLIGITCGLSAPYAGSMVDFTMDAFEAEEAAAAAAAAGGGGGDGAPPAGGTQYYGVAMGFNPVELARGAPIEMWRDRPAGRSKTFLDVARRLDALQQRCPGRFALLNPVVGPEPVTASSRMKGGSVTKVLLEAAFARGMSEATGLPLLPAPTAAAAPPAAPPAAAAATAAAAVGDGTAPATTEDVLQAFEMCVRHTYLQADDIAELVDAAGGALRGGGRMAYLGGGSAACMGFIDASEMPDTFGCPFDEVRGFVDGGWAAVGNVDGDIGAKGALFRVGLGDFEREVLPGLVAGRDLVCVLADGGVGAGSAGGVSEAVLAAATKAHAAGVKVVAAYWETAGEGAEAGEGGAEARGGGLGAACPALAALCAASVTVTQPRSELLRGYRAFTEFSTKLVANAVTTGAQVQKGFVYGNRMINVGPSNNKIYCRCVELISLIAKVPPADAEQYMLKAVYRVDELPAGLMDEPTSNHIKAATPSEDKRLEQQQTLPLAVLLACKPDFTVAAALEALAKDPVVRNVIKAHSA